MPTHEASEQRSHEIVMSLLENGIKIPPAKRDRIRLLIEFYVSLPDEEYLD